MKLPQTLLLDSYASSCMMAVFSFALFIWVVLVSLKLPCPQVSITSYNQTFIQRSGQMDYCDNLA